MEAKADRLVKALAYMVEQYLDRKDRGFINNYAMTAGQLAMEVLAEHGLIDMDPKGRTGQWTGAGREMLR